MKSRPLPRLLRTLWYLRREQWSGQLRRALPVRSGPARLGLAAPQLRLERPLTPWLGAPPHTACQGLDRIRLINQEVSFRQGIRWDVSEQGPLFAYHLHQFDWMRNAELSASERARALRSWISDHREGIGWDPGPISLRTFAWLKLLTTPGALPEDDALRDELLRSLADQLATLEKRLERHLLANHYLWNLLALVFAGISLEGSRSAAWRRHEALLLRELDEEVPADGAHFERSPMYHALLLENLLDLVNVLRSAPPSGGDAIEARLVEVAARMVGALRLWTCPDGRVALFADSAHGIAHPPERLEAYARDLGVEGRDPLPAGVLKQAGYVRLQADPFVLIASAAPPTPSYQPGHAHCDALSFVLCVGDERVVTDTGVYEYAPGRRRDLARATRSHATVEVCDSEQAELWAAHRIGGRPDVAFNRTEPPGFAEGVCASWASPEVLHRRRFHVSTEEVVLEDLFDVPARYARLCLPLAPGLEPALDGSVARLRLTRGGPLRIELPETARWRIERAPYFPEFGLEIERAMLVGEAQQLAEARWRIAIDR